MSLNKIYTTDFDDLKILREKSFCMFPHYITAGPPQREEVLREILIKYLGVFIFLNFIEVCHNEWMRGHTIFW